MTLSDQIFNLNDLHENPNLECYPNQETRLERGTLSWNQKDKAIHLDNIKFKLIW